jgi:tRNA A37 N6-isopentenylltransferase MiaA
MEINITDYLNHEEIKDAARDAVKDIVYGFLKTETDMERILSNHAYKIVQDMVSDRFDGDMEEILITNTKKVIKQLSANTVFKPKSAWDGESSKGWDLLQEALVKYKERIFNNVAQRIDELTTGEAASEIKAAIEQTLYEVVQDRLFKQEGSE